MGYFSSYDALHPGNDEVSTKRIVSTGFFIKTTIYRQDIDSIHVHTVIRLYPLLAEVDGGSRPVHVVMINGDKHNVFREQVELEARVS